MAFITLNDILPEAKQEHYAIPQFNINGFLWIESILEIAEEMKSPLIIGATDRNVERLGGYRLIKEVTFQMMEKWEISSPIVLHLDHGQSVENCKKAIEAGFTSVMYDGSHLPLKENIRNTKEVVHYAKKFSVSVEGEIGAIGGSEDGLSSTVSHADFDECKSFVEETDVSALAAALGSVHGQYKGEPNLNFRMMGKINNEIDIPLVLHGASGIPNNQVRKAIKLGHTKINYNTELNMAWAKAIRDVMSKDVNLYDPKVILTAGKQALKEVAKEKITLLK